MPTPETQPVKPLAGRRAADQSKPFAYAETWAERYSRSQLAIEAMRRVDPRLARHRAATKAAEG